MNYNRLRGRIIEKYGKYSSFADAVGVTQQTIWNKLNGRSEISQCEVRKWSDLLDIPQSEIGSYFFTVNVSKS